MTETSTIVSAGTDDGFRVLTDWVEAFGAALGCRDADALAALFQEECVVRDLLALSWDFRNAVGRDEVVRLLIGEGSTVLPQVGSRSRAPIINETTDGTRTLDGFFQFKTASGGGDGYVQLALQDDHVWRATTLLLSLSTLDSHPEQIDEFRPLGREHGAIKDRLGFYDQLDRDFEKQDPAVVIIGAGHNGLMITARLRAMGIPALIIENNERVGDNWRKRYASLALHTPLLADQLPYLPFPSTWTRFTPKDKLGDFLESYATLLDLAVWTSSRVEDVTYDETSQRWTFDVVRADGSRRRMAPHHLVIATGINGAPKHPTFPGQDEFQGEVIHAVDYKGHQTCATKRVVVVGSGVSGHDIAQDLAEHGVDVTMIQRSPTVVLNVSTFHKVMHATHTSGKYTVDQGDLINEAIPFGLLPKFGARQLAAANAMDRETLDGLEAAGFELSDGPDGTGVLGLIFGQNATGYYYNAGASHLIIDGTIKLRHGAVTGFSETGIILDNHGTIEADLVVFATGYEPPTAAARKILGDEVADQLGEFAQVGDDLEYGRLWRHSGFDRLWFMIALSIEHGRFYSKLLALQIAAIEAGIVSPSLK